MALQLARGLFRLWLVLTVLWIGGVGYLTWQTFPSSVVPVERAAPPGDLVPIEPPPWAARVEQEQAAREAVRFAIVLALVPAFVLALGSALVWAFRGFR